MKAYVAFPSTYLDSARSLMAEVRDAGFEIAHDWTMGIELKESYFERACLNLRNLTVQTGLFDDEEYEPFSDESLDDLEYEQASCR